MTVKTSQKFSASVDEIYKLLTDKAFLQSKYEGVGSRNVNITECGQDEDVFRIEWTREVPMNPPSFAKKFLSAWNKCDEVMEWSRDGDTAHANYECRVKGIPGTLYGEFDLSADGDGSVENIAMRADVKIPLVGKKIGSFVEDDVAGQLEREYEFTQKHLGG